MCFDLRTLEFILPIMKQNIRISSSSLLILVLCFSFSIASGDIFYLKAPSLALTDSNRVIVATPDAFDINRKQAYPFIIMLHGWSGDETQWDNDADLQALCDTHNILLVLPDGGYDGWWVDTEVSQGRNYATHIRQEIKILIVENFNGSPLPEQHGIMGLSMGGFGAMNQALKHPDNYAAAASLSGVMDVTRHTENWHLTNALGLYTEEPSRWEQSNPLHLAMKKAPPASPPLLLICGRDDFAFQENKEMAQQLQQSGYTSFFREEEGTHSHLFWKTHVASAIEFIVSYFK